MHNELFYYRRGDRGTGPNGRQVVGKGGGLLSPSPPAGTLCGDTGAAG